MSLDPAPRSPRDTTHSIEQTHSPASRIFTSSPVICHSSQKLGSPPSMSSSPHQSLLIPFQATLSLPLAQPPCRPSRSPALIIAMCSVISFCAPISYSSKPLSTCCQKIHSKSEREEKQTETGIFQPLLNTLEKVTAGSIMY